MDRLFSEYDVADIDTDLVHLSHAVVGVRQVGPFDRGECIPIVIFNWATGEIQFCEGDTVVYSTKLNLVYD